MEQARHAFRRISAGDSIRMGSKIQEDLKGADYEKKLVWKTIEGFKVKPYYTAEDLRNLQYLKQEPGCFPFCEGKENRRNAWEIRQDFRVR